MQEKQFLAITPPKQMQILSFYQSRLRQPQCPLVIFAYSKVEATLIDKTRMLV